MTTPAHTLAGTLLLDAEAIERTLSRIAHEIIERNPELDRDHGRARLHERPCQRAGSGAEVEDEVAGANAGAAHELVCERATTKDVQSDRARAATRAPGSDGHGRPPSSWSSESY